MAFQFIFKRVEKKYILNKSQYELVIDAIKEYMAIDKHGETAICNLYFDSSTDKLIQLSIEKPVYKEKLRLRSYGLPQSDDSTVFFEIKKKYKGIVYKRRISLSLKDAEDYIATGRFPKDINNQVAKEIDYMVKFHQLSPRVFLAYDRTAWFSKEDKNLRITFDKNIRSRYEDVNLRSTDKGTLLLPDDTYIMEIKIPGATPLWLSRLLSDSNIFSESFSKYGNVYKNTIKGDNNYV